MNIFSSQEIVVFMVIIFTLLSLLILIVILFIGKRSPTSDGLKQVDELNQAEAEKWGKISSTLSTPIAPELEIGTEDPPRYQKKKYFFSFQERKFFEFLSASVGDSYQIFAKVRMADVLYLANEPMRKKYFNSHIRCRHFDYILCELSKQRPIMAIELDDSSHQRYDRRASDDFKNMACQTAGLPLLRIRLPNKYSHEELSSLIQTEIENAQ